MTAIDPFQFENEFWRLASPKRLAKTLVHSNLFYQTRHLPGALAEFGVFKGVSFFRWAMLREIYGPRRLIGFDVFGRFPDSAPQDGDTREKFTSEAGDRGLALIEIWKALQARGIDHEVDLIAGDICETLPAFLEKNPGVKFSLINLDVDIYAPTRAILEHAWPRLCPGGVIILDDYDVYPGETAAVDAWARERPGVQIRRMGFAPHPCYVIKELGIE